MRILRTTLLRLLSVELWSRRNRLAAYARVGTLGAALVIMLLMSPTANATHGGSTPAGYTDVGSAWAGVGIDSRVALQAFLDDASAAGDKIFVPKMAGDWTIGPMFLNRDNQDILFEDGVVMEALAGAFPGGNDSLFRADDTVNNSMTGYGATFSMANLSPIVDFEWRHGIRLMDVENFSIAGLTVTDTQGDGIYLGSNAQALYNKNVTIEDVVVDRAYRNGIGVISVQGLVIDNAVVVNTGGTSPEAGIDFEPNFPTQRIEDIIVRNSIFASSGDTGIQFAIGDSEQVTPVTGLIENVTVFANGKLGIDLNRDALPGLEIKDTLLVNNSMGGIRVTAGNGPSSVAYSAFSGNGGYGDFAHIAMAGTGTITGTAPDFVNDTDPTNPLYLYLDPSTSTLISLGDFDGSFIGARGVAGDFDADAGIDGFDFLAWQRGDSPNNGSADDLAAWEQFFGETGAPLSSLAASVGAVPEPSTSLLLLAGLASGSLLPRRGKRRGAGNPCC